MIADKIDQIKQIRRQLELVANKEEELTKPILHDLDHIPVIYGWFCKILRKMDFPPDVKSVIQRKKFLVIIILLYSPVSFTGKWILWGLRKKLAETIGITSKSTISDNCADVIILYNKSLSYREEIDMIYQQLYRRIVAKGWAEEN